MPTRTHAHPAPPPAEVSAGFRLWALKSAVYLLATASCLFLSAGRFDWPLAWLYLATVAAVQVLDVLLLPRELLAERSRKREGTARGDLPLALVIALVGPLSLGIVAGLDARNNWTPPLPAALVAVAWMAAVAGSMVTIWAMRANRFFSGTVRIQPGHTVATDGPYRYVRHPGYTGMILFYLASPLVLGSLWALLLTPAIVLATVIRTGREDRTLHAELPGYPAYAARTRYRLVPGLW